MGMNHAASKKTMEAITGRDDVLQRQLTDRKGTSGTAGQLTPPAAAADKTLCQPKWVSSRSNPSASE